jgi:hypothetical protein
MYHCCGNIEENAAVGYVCTLALLRLVQAFRATRAAVPAREATRNITASIQQQPFLDLPRDNHGFKIASGI